ncbi:T9SS type A sorting domain-containing protein [Candidatus Poribacteria bacterium]|nr:T9SS type A sorting domain-containing protein [Candidatus Poribacteria bacterium]
MSAYDAALILQYVVGLIDHFPVEDITSPSAIMPRNYVVRVPEQTAKAGDRIYVPIVIDDVTGLLAGGISLKYDKTVLLAIRALSDITLNDSYWKANTALDGEVRFGFANPQPMKGQGNLLLVEFEVLPNTEGKTSPLILDNIDLSNSLTITKINGSITVLPSRSILLQNYPNPFNPDTWLPFKLAQNAPVSINIYDTKGQLIRTIALGNKNAGIYLTTDKAAYWDGRDSFGEKVSSGVYYYTLQAGEFRATRKMVIVK